MESPTAFNFVDAVALLALIAGAVIGFRRGLSDQLARPLSLLLGLLAALYLYAPMQTLMGYSQGLSPEMRGAATIALTALATIVCMALARLLLTRLIRLFVAQESERVGGVVLGLVRAALAVFIVLLLVNAVPHAELHRVAAEESMVGRHVARIAPALSRKLEELRLVHGRREDEEPAARRKSAAQSVREGKQDRAENWTHIQDR